MDVVDGMRMELLLAIRHLERQVRSQRVCERVVLRLLTCFCCATVLLSAGECARARVRKRGGGGSRRQEAYSHGFQPVRGRAQRTGQPGRGRGLRPKRIARCHSLPVTLATDSDGSVTWGKSSGGLVEAMDGVQVRRIVR
jgi:hypothetical protein